jgi:hypothetical protein
MQLADTLRSLVRFEVARRRARLGDDGVNEVDKIIQQSVKKMKDAEITSVYIINMMLDEARRFGNELVTEAQNEKADVQAIGAKIVSAVKSRLCPIFPFC